VASAGGWTEPATGERFLRFAERVAAHLGDLVGRWCTFNEPNMVATMGHLAGVFPPGRRDRALRRAVNDVFVAAHLAAVPMLHASGTAPVGLTVAMEQMWPVGDTAEELATAQSRADHILDGLEDPFLVAAQGDDYVGVQTYSRLRVGPEGALGPEEGVRRTIMGYEFWPETLEACIRRATLVTEGVPVLVTENGIATADDAERIEYVERALRGVLTCLADGITVLGYTYWSLLDNFEWSLGYGPTFGLIAVDRDTQERRVKPSARWLGAVARANALPA
jgi:beta-glucosidase